MRRWPVQNAKARFSEFLNACLNDGPQIVTRRGTEAAVLVPIAEWETMRRAARPTLKDMLLTDDGRIDMEVPARGSWRSRPPPDFG